MQRYCYRAVLFCLYVDDSADNRLLIKTLLTRTGFSEETAHDGSSGVQKALAGAYDHILMDIQMPKLNGYEALRELQKVGYNRPVVALTAHATLEEQERTRLVGFSSHLV
ncbi:MAG: response regulator, partial [Proteobacteria bacterium]